MKLVCLLKLTNHGKTLWEGLSINQMHWELQQLLVCGLRYNCKNPWTSHITTYTELVIVIPVSTYTGSLRTGSRLEPSVIQGERDEPRVVWWGGSVRSTRFARGVTTLRLARRIFFPSSLGACSQARPRLFCALRCRNIVSYDTEILWLFLAKSIYTEVCIWTDAAAWPTFVLVLELVLVL